MKPTFGQRAIQNREERKETAQRTLLVIGEVSDREFKPRPLNQ